MPFYNLQTNLKADVKIIHN